MPREVVVYKFNNHPSRGQFMLACSQNDIIGLTFGGKGISLEALVPKECEEQASVIYRSLGNLDLDAPGASFFQFEHVAAMDTFIDACSQNGMGILCENPEQPLSIKVPVGSVAKALTIYKSLGNGKPTSLASEVVWGMLNKACRLGSVRKEPGHQERCSTLADVYNELKMRGL